MPIDVVLGKPEEEKHEGLSYDSVVGSLVSRLETAYALVREELQVAAERRKKQYDLRVRESNFKVETWVGTTALDVTRKGHQSGRECIPDRSCASRHGIT